MPAADGRSYTKAGLAKRQQAANRRRVDTAVQVLKNLPAPKSGPVLENERSKSATRTGAQPAKKFGSGYHPPRYFDFLVHKGADNQLHYPKGSGRFLVGPTRLNIDRLLSTRRSAAERSQALSELQSRGKLPSDTTLKYLSEPRIALPKLHIDKLKPVKGHGLLHNVLDEVYQHTPLPILKSALSHQGPATKVLGGAAALLHKTTSGKTLVEREMAGIGAPPSLGERVRTSLQKGILASGGAVAEGLDRPLAATEAGIGKGLVDVGAIKGKTAQEIRQARGPKEAFLHGRRWGKDVSGATIAKGIGLPKQVGLGIDLATDPVMYAGLALAPETGGATLPGVIARIQRVAPEILHGAEATKAFKTYHETQDLRALTKTLKKLSTSKAIREVHAQRGRNIAAAAIERKNATHFTMTVPQRKARNLFRRTETQRPIHVAGQDAVDAATHALSSAEARRVRPQVRLQPMTPLGRRIGPGIPIIPERIGRHIPLRPILKKERQKLELGAARQAQTRLDEELRKQVKELDDQIGNARRRRQADTVRELERAKDQLVTNYRLKSEDVRSLAKEEIGGRLPLAHTLGDVVDTRNAKLATHTGKISADEYGRYVQARFSNELQQATRILKGSAKDRARSLKRVQLHLIAESDTKGAGVADLARAITLTPQEEKVANNFRAVYDAMLEHGRQTGVLPQGVEDYVGHRLWSKLDSPQDLAEEVQSIAHGRASSTGYQRHRVHQAVSDFADPAAYAGALKELADHPISDTEALDIANRLWGKGNQRALTELTVRRLQRGEEVPWESLTPMERTAVDRAARQPMTGVETDRPLFATPLTHGDQTEGLVLPHDFETHGFATPETIAGLTPSERDMVKLHSLVTDRQRVHSMIDGMGPGRDAELQQLHEIENRLTAAIDQLPKEMHLPQHEAELEKLNKVLKARTAETDKQIAALGPKPTSVEQAVEAARPTWVKDHENWQFGDYTVRPGTGGWAIWHGDEEVTQARGLVAAKRQVEAMHGASVEPAASSSLAVLKGQWTRQRNNILKSENTDLADTRKRIIELEQGSKELPASPGHFTKVFDDHGDLWIRGPGSKQLPPPEGIFPRSAGEAGPFDDPFDTHVWLGDLPDLRGTGREMVELDPRVSGHVRSRAQGLTSAFQARWQAADSVHGRSASEYFDRPYIVKADGSRGKVKDLQTVRNADGQVTYYKVRGTTPEIKYDPHELEFPEPTLIPNTAGDIWLDTSTNTEYMFARKTLGTTLMVGNIEADRLWPAQVLDAFTQEMKHAGEYDQIYKTGMETGFQRFMSLVRFGVTTPFPAYHVRNMVSDLIKSLQADSGVLFHPIVNAKLTAAAFNKGLSWHVTFPGMGKMKIEDFLFVADMFGVRSGHHVAEVAQLMKDGKFTESRLKDMHQRFNPFHAGGYTTKFGAHREDVVRLMTYMQRLKANGGDAADAAWYMIRHHFNYNDLTQAEKRTIRNAFLFYTWYRKNIPLQLTELVRRPGFFAGMEHTYSETAQGGAPWNYGPFEGPAPDQPALPDYVHDKIASITTNWNGFALNVGFGAPWSDLQFASVSGLTDAAGQLASPVLQLPVELMFRVDPLTKRRFKERESSGYANIFAALGVDLPKDEKGNPTLPWWENIILRQLPLAGRASYGFQTVSGTRDPGRLQKYGQLLAPITGLNIYVSPHPGDKREKAAILKQIGGRAAERRNLLEGLSNFPTNSKYYLDRVKKFDAETLKIAKQKGWMPYLASAKYSGFYEPQSRRKGGGMSIGGHRRTGFNLSGQGRGGIHLP